MNKRALRKLKESRPEIILEQLEERIVLDGAIDDVSLRVDFSSAQVSGDHGDSESHVSEFLVAESLTIDPLVLETGTETLPDGTWHYWEQDWDASGNGYRFDAWQDGSSSFHQIQWDAAANSKGTHNGFDYNLQRDASWTYQAVQWDQDRDGYSYDATSTGTYHYETHQWSNGLGYDYASDNTGIWYYHVVTAGNASGDRAEYMADSTGWGDYTYTWANGYSWHTDNAVSGKEVYHVVDGTWSYEYLVSTDTGYWKKTLETDARFAYHYASGQWDQGRGGSWSKLGTSLSPVFIGDGTFHDIGNGWSYAYASSTDTAQWSDSGKLRFEYQYDVKQWWSHSDFGGLQQLGTANASVSFMGDGAKHYVQGMGSWQFQYLGSYAEWTGGSINYRYYYDSGQWKVPDITGTVWGDLGLAEEQVSCPYGDLGEQVAGVSDPWWFTWYNGALYFQARDDLHGRELWKWDGTQASLVADINKGPDGIHYGYDSSPSYLTVYNGKLYFSAANGLGLDIASLYVFDGTTLTQLVNTVYQSVQHGGSGHQTENVNNLIVYNNTLYFSEDNGVYTWGLYSYNGSSFALYGADYNVAGVALENNPHFTIFNDSLYLAGAWKYSGSPGDYKLWKFNGSGFTGVGETSGVNSPNWISNMFVYDNALYFRATDKGGGSTHGYELWKCTSSDVVSRVIDLNTGNPVGSHQEWNSNPGMLTAFNGLLYFDADDGVNGRKLYSYNSVSDAVTRIDQPSVGMWSDNESFTVYNGTMICETGGANLYMYDGTNWFLIGKSGSNDGWFNKPRHYGVFNGHYFYAGGPGGLWQWE